MSLSDFWRLIDQFGCGQSENEPDCTGLCLLLTFLVITVFVIIVIVILMFFFFLFFTSYNSAYLFVDQTLKLEVSRKMLAKNPVEKGGRNVTKATCIFCVFLFLKFKKKKKRERRTLISVTRVQNVFCFSEFECFLGNFLLCESALLFAQRGLTYWERLGVFSTFFISNASMLLKCN